MKKTLLTVMLAIATTFAMAQTYTDNLEVSIMGSKEAPQETTIVVNQASDGTYTLSLNNFILGGAIPVGNIVIDNIATTESNGIKSFALCSSCMRGCSFEKRSPLWTGRPWTKQDIYFDSII
jgi:hypothetical protein